MTEDIGTMFEADISSIHASRISGEDEAERIMKLMAHMFLRVWTRFAVETGQKLTMTPYQYSLGMYHGQMNWAVNEALNFKELPQIELGAAYGKKHALMAEMYTAKDEPRVRLVFSLEDEAVKGKPLFVNYLLYDSTVKAFKFEGAVESVKAAMPKWFETVITKTDAPLWGYCKESLECVGV